MVGTSLTSNLWICHCESLALSEHHSPGCICKFPTTRRSERCLLGLAACVDQAKHLLHDRINRANKADSQFLRACYFLICLGHTLDDCLTSIGIAHFVSKFLLAELRQNKKYSKDMPLPFIVRMYNIKDEDPNLLTEEETQKYVADSVVTSECWLTRYAKPVKVQKLWLVGGEVVLWPYIVDGVVYNYPIVRNSIWADSKTLPDPEFQNQIMDITQKWLNEA